MTRLWTGVQFLAGTMNEFCLCHHAKTSSKANQTPHHMGTGGVFPKSKAAGREVNHLHLVPTLRMLGTIPLLTHTPTWRGAYRVESCSYYNSFCNLVNIYISSSILIIF